MLEVYINNQGGMLKFNNKEDLFLFIEEEKNFFELFWYTDSEKKKLIKENNNIFANDLKNETLKKYNVILNKIHNVSFDVKSDISDLFKANDLCYSKSSFAKELQRLKSLSMEKVTIYLLGIFTKSIEVENELNSEIFELATIKFEEYDKEHNRKEPYRVLVIEGGGILGYYEATLLYELNKYFGGDEDNDIGSSFNMICGTSTGGILASGLAKGITLGDIKRLYKENASSIFPSPTPEKGLSLFFWFIKHLNKSSASQEVLKKLLDNTFENSTFLNIWKNRNIALCIPSLLVNTHTPCVFQTPHFSSNQFDNLKLSDACLASSAAPIFFPLAKIKENENYTDGGLWANNPILIGLMEAMKMADKNQDIEIYSLAPPINNEANIDFITEKKQGIIHWKVGINIINLSLFSQSLGYNSIAKSLGKSFTRLGKKVSIIPFPKGSPGKDFLHNFGLDKNDEKTFLAMESEIKSVINSIEDYEYNNFLKNIFS